MKYTVGYYATFKKPIYVVVAFCSRDGINKINNQILDGDITFKVGEYMKSHMEIISEQIATQNLSISPENVTTKIATLNIALDKNWYYFDHKWPDDLSFLLESSINSQLRYIFGWGCHQKPVEIPNLEPFPSKFNPPYDQLCRPE
jgi:hypothetical protein